MAELQLPELAELELPELPELADRARPQVDPALAALVRTRPAVPAGRAVMRAWCIACLAA